MRRLSSCVRGLFALAIFALAPALGYAQGVRRPSAADSLDDFLSKATRFENQQLWQQAADVYERAVRLYPKHPDLHERWQKAERLYSLSRRYHDRSYTDELLALGEKRASGLYREILRKIETHYVDDVQFHELIRYGYRNLDLALEQKVFVQKNFPDADALTIEQLRQELASRAVQHTVTARSAVEEAKIAGWICEKAGIVRVTPVILEFITAACEGLDQYSTHLSPNRLRDLYAMIDGNFVGLGVEVRGAADGLTIVSVLPGSPAQSADLSPGSTIVAVDHKPIGRMGAEEAANLLQGAEGSKVVLTVRERDGRSRSVIVVRREVIVHSVTAAKVFTADRPFGYIKMNSFQKLTVGELDDAVGELTRQGIDGLVIDLRGNPGGLLDVSLEVAKRFIRRGVLVSTQGRARQQSWHAHGNRPVWEMPLVVMIDQDSASASEIFAGAIKDHGRGVLVGTRTYGKGSVQSIFPLRAANTGLRLTTARFYSPNGNGYQNVGVEPDVVVTRPNANASLPAVPDPQTDPQLQAALSAFSASATASRSPLTDSSVSR